MNEPKFKNKEERAKEFKELFCFMQEKLDPLVEWLDSIGYFTAPAAKKHHSAYEGGLFDHSREVTRELMDITLNMRLTWCNPWSPVIVGMLHDICKTDDYVITGEDQDGVKIEYNSDKIMEGHGDKSVMMLAGHFDLTEEEAMCIRFHMGAFTEKEEWKYYSKAVHDYPNVLWTHTADMIASQVIGI